MGNRKEIGLILNALRTHQLGIGQGAFANILGVTQGTISKIENGELAITLDQFFKLMLELNLNYDMFICKIEFVKSLISVRPKLKESEIIETICEFYEKYKSARPILKLAVNSNN